MNHAIRYLAVMALLLSTGVTWAGSVNLAWDAPAELPPASCTGQTYVVSWGTATGSYATGSLNVPIGTNTASVTGLTIGTKYFFAANLKTANCGTSAWSNEVSVTIPVVGPGNLRIPPAAAAMGPRTGGLASLGQTTNTSMRLTNTSGSAYSILGVTMSGEAADMVSVGDITFPRLLPAGRALSIPVSITPTDRGFLTADAKVLTDQGFVPYQISFLAQ